MKDEAVGSIGVLGVIAVAVALFYSFYITGLWRKILSFSSNRTTLLWFVSTVIALASLLYIVLHFSVDEKISKNRGLFLTALGALVVSLVIWVVLSSRILTKELYVNFASLDLYVLPMYVTIFSTLVILACVASATNDWKLIVAASLLVLHYMFVDSMSFVNVYSNMEKASYGKYKKKKLSI